MRHLNLNDEKLSARSFLLKGFLFSGPLMSRVQDQFRKNSDASQTRSDPRRPFGKLHIDSKNLRDGDQILICSV